jgi:hypothetical protein
MVLPFLTAQIPQIGAALGPMHIPVLLSGFLAGPFYAAAVGFIAPILRFLIFTTPPLPMAITMCFELAAYGFIAGMLYLKLPDRTSSIYVSLIAAMFFGRVVWGITAARVFTLLAPPPWLYPFGFQTFISAAFVGAVPGIILHIVLIPIIVIALRRAGFSREKI